MAKFSNISIKMLHPNNGQIEGLPANPRQITEAKLQQLKKDIQDYPEMLEMRALMVYPHNGEYVIVGGNMRYRAMVDLGMDTAPCVVIPEGTDAERLKAYTILDNSGFGQWDWDALANEWDDMQLTQWGVDLPSFNPLDLEEEEDVVNDDTEDTADDTEETEDAENGYKIAYELVFNDEAEQTDFYDLLKELKNDLRDYSTISERILVALRFWRDNHGEED